MDPKMDNLAQFLGRSSLRKALPLVLVLLILLSCNLINPPAPATSTRNVLAATPAVTVTRTGPEATREVSSGVQGSVEWEAGRCCAGGVAGETIQIQADFEAESRSGVVTDMRVATGGMCMDEAGMAKADWEPFVPSKEYPVQVALNWIGYYISVQYRDNQGGISPIYCDDISVEGAPAAP